MDNKFSEKVLAWARKHGRKNLPWQQQVTPYRVWVSEIMLQQTQVKTVIPYYEKFIGRFPDIQALADSSIDEVLHYWSGLGYYARARNLHKAAQIICEKYGGIFPEDAQQLSSLPGIGRSTAGAILSLSKGLFHAILDGNVKRVLSRCFEIEGWPGHSRVLKDLWGISEQLTPGLETALYNQAMMDLGSMVCTRSRPDCKSCPLTGECGAYKKNTQLKYPGRKIKKALPVKQTVMLLIKNREGALLMHKRPPSGIWGGLWSFPELKQVEASKLPETVKNCLGINISSPAALSERRHTFSHYHLDILPFTCHFNGYENDFVADNESLWYKPDQIETIGLAAPVSKLVRESYE